MGFQSAIVASMDAMVPEQAFYEDWLAKGYAASMDYLKRDPHKRNSPSLLCPQACSAVILQASYYTNVPDDPGSRFGQVARYAVGLDYHNVIVEKLAELKGRIEEKLGRPLLGKYFTDNVDLFEQGLASRHGLGFIGKNSLLIGPKMSGSYHFVAEFFTDIEMEADQKYEGSCGKCFRCGAACPTQAIVDERTVDSNLCISFLTIENKGAIPRHLRKKVSNWIFGCDICQEVCPYNQRPPETQWKEFLPEAGAGHFLDLFEMIKIKDKKSFMERFGKTAISRCKRFGIVRNALVVIGNRRPEEGQAELCSFIESEQNETLIEHALWALSNYDDGESHCKKLFDGAPETLKIQIRKELDAQIS